MTSTSPIPFPPDSPTFSNASTALFALNSYKREHDEETETALPNHRSNLLGGSPDEGLHAVNSAISRIGMGKYQWMLFALCGAGWLADNMWIQALAVALPQLQIEFGVTDNISGLGLAATFCGMIFGALGWGVLSDVWGRRPAFNLTLLITAVFGGVAGLAPNFPAFCVLMFSLGLGVGGNLPVDGALFLEAIPKENQKLLTLLSVFWPCGQFITSICGFILIPPTACTPEVDPDCTPSMNNGWRYVFGTLSVFTFIMFFARFFFFELLESPKFLLSRGRREDAHVVLHDMAGYNGTCLNLEVDDLPRTVKIKSKLGQFGLQQIQPLLAKRLRKTTILIWMIWSFLSVGYTMFNGFLPKFLAAGNGSNELSLKDTYRDFMIVSLFGIPGTILATFLIETRAGRKGTMTIATLGTAASMLLFTITTAHGGQLAASCFAQFLQNIMYGVLYAYTPEVFNSEVRGTATGTASAMSRVAGVIAPIVTGLLLTLDLHLPLYVATANIFLGSLCMAFLPIETRGKQAL